MAVHYEFLGYAKDNWMRVALSAGDPYRRALDVLPPLTVMRIETGPGTFRFASYRRVEVPDEPVWSWEIDGKHLLLRRDGDVIASILVLPGTYYAVPVAAGAVRIAATHPGIVVLSRCKVRAAGYEIVDEG